MILMKLELIDNHYLKNQTSRESVKGFSTPFIPIDIVTLSDMFLSSPHCERVKSSITPLHKKKVPFKGKHRLENTFHVEDGRLEKCEVV